MNQAINPDNQIVATNGSRGVTIWHRQGIANADVIVLFPAPSFTLTDVPNAVGGALLAGTQYSISFGIYNRYGVANSGSYSTLTTSSDSENNHAINLAFSQVTGAQGYDLFSSANGGNFPQWVARITEAQRAAGCTVTGIGVVSPTSPGAGIVQIQVVGNGLASGSGIFSFGTTTAMTPELVTPISCIGYSQAFVYSRLNIAPGVNLSANFPPASAILFTMGTLKSDPTPGDFFPVGQGVSFPLGPPDQLKSILSSGTTTLNLDGVTSLVVLAGSGFGRTFAPPYEYTVDVFVELS